MRKGGCFSGKDREMPQISKKGGIKETWEKRASEGKSALKTVYDSSGKGAGKKKVRKDCTKEHGERLKGDGHSSGGVRAF